MNNIKDNKLEEFITKIKDSKNSTNKLLYYKKATKRLDELKIEHNRLCKCLKKSIASNKNQTENSATSSKKIHIEKIITELNKMSEEIDNNNCDMSAIIDNYIQYKLLINSLETESEHIKNEFFKVNQEKNQIIVQRLNEEDII